MAAVYASHRDCLLTPEASAVTLGVFDGVHLGHQALLGDAVARARANGLRPLAMTFHPHPAHLIRPAAAPALIEPLSWRTERLAALGFQAIVVEPFDAQLAAMEPQDFVSEILCQRLGTRELVVGEGFRFGRGQAGGIHDLAGAGNPAPIRVYPMSPVLAGGQVVSSSRIRKAVAAGDVAGAAKLLGRPFSVVGTVVAGARRGRTLGFPTANIACQNELQPAMGVYAGWAKVAGHWQQTVVNIGVAPTFANGGCAKVEAHLIGYCGGSLYGERLAVALMCRLRAEQRFAGVDALVAQIRLDIGHAEAALAAGPPAADLLSE